MAIRPKLPLAIREELGVQTKRRHKRNNNVEREPRKKRKLYQAQQDDPGDEKTAVRAPQLSLKRSKDPIPKSGDDILMEKDDAEIDYWEAKLGQKKGASQDELEDGLDDIFAGLDLPRGASRLEEVSEDGDESGSADDMQDFLDAEQADHSAEEVPTLVQHDNQDDFTNFDDENVAVNVKRKPSIYKPYSEKETSDVDVQARPSAYVPPALRNKQGNQDSAQVQRQVKGQINRLSAVNISTIVNELESMYRSHPRGILNDALASHLMDVVSDKSGLLDSFVILHAALIAALYKLHGTDFGASFVQSLVENILENTDTELATGRRTINLMALVAELYNFNIIAATLPYDFIRTLIADLNELNVEKLLVIIRSSGSQLRSDDPSSLKDILSLLQSEMKVQYGDKEMPLRMKFMVDSLLNLKNNKVSPGEGQQAKELRTRMKKYIGSLSASSGQSGSEPLRVTLADIRNVDTRGKWWLIGASWKSQELEVKESMETARPGAAYKDESRQEELFALARQYRLNNPIRKQIFVTILSSSDYLEAITSILSLRLKKSQESEISRVLMLLVGSEERYNPFYTHIAKGIADRHGMRISFQFCLWDFLRDCGETEVGQIGFREDEEETSSEAPSTRKLINIAKFFGALMGYQVLPLTVFKTLTFSRIQRSTKLFLDVLLSELLLTVQASIKVTSKTQGQHDFERRVAEIFGKIKQFDLANKTSMVKGLDWFLRKVVAKGSSVLERDVTIVQEGVEIARIVLSQ